MDERNLLSVGFVFAFQAGVAMNTGHGPAHWEDSVAGPDDACQVLELPFSEAPHRSTSLGANKTWIGRVQLDKRSLVSELYWLRRVRCDTGEDSLEELSTSWPEDLMSRY